MNIKNLHLRPSFEMNRRPNGVYNLDAGILRKAGVIFVPLYENKKSLGLPGLGFLGVT